MNRKTLLTAALAALIGFNPGICMGDDFSFGQEAAPDLSSPEMLIRAQIYALDRRMQSARMEMEAMQLELMQVLKENQLDKVKELNERISLQERKIKDIRVELDILIGDYQGGFARRPWWRKLMFEIGPQYTFFDNDLKINDVVGTRLRGHLRQDTFGRYHAYPFLQTDESPIQELIGSPLIIEYRNSSHDVEGQNKKSRVESYLAGFGLTGQLKKNTFIHLSVLGGIQDYSDMTPDDIGLILSYSMGLQKQFSSSFALGLTATEDWAITKATQPDGQTRSFFNFSLSLLGRIKF